MPSLVTGLPIEMARLIGLEPMTDALEEHCFIQLSYKRIKEGIENYSGNESNTLTYSPIFSSSLRTLFSIRLLSKAKWLIALISS